MKTTLAFYFYWKAKVFSFFECIYFWRFFNFDCFILEIYSKYNLEAISFMAFYTLALQFYQKIGKKEEDDIFLRKKGWRKTKKCYHDHICKWKGASFPVKLKLQGESFE